MDRLHLPVEEYTTPNPVTASRSTSAEDLILMMDKYGIHHLPILDASKVVGIVSDRDLRMVRALPKTDRGIVTAETVMAPDPFTVSSEDSLDQVAFAMVENKIGSVIVNDTDDQFLGIFTSTDALNALIEIARAASKNHLEEVVE